MAGRGWASAAVVVGAIGVAFALAVGIGAVVADGGFEDAVLPEGDQATTTRPEPEESEPSASDLEREASVTFSRAAQWLRSEGSFAYSGYVEARGVDRWRPASLLDGHVTVQGQVSLPRRVREVAVDESGRAFETVLVGPGVWERSAARVDDLPAAPLVLTARGTLEQGAPLLLYWLDDATSPELTGPTRDGGQRFVGRLSYPDSPDTPSGLVITLDVDDREAPTHVRIESEPASFVLDWDITDLGEPVEIPTPGDRPVSITPVVTAADVAAAGIAAPVQLTQVPAGWILADAWIEPDRPRPGCSVLWLEYTPVDAEDDRDGYLDVEVQAETCRPDWQPGTEPFVAGAYTGEAFDYGNWSGGRVSDGATSIGFESSLVPDDVRPMLETVAPFDPGEQPTPVDGLGAS